MQQLSMVRDDTVEECHPDIVRTASGRLLIVYRESDQAKPRRFSHIVVRESRDGGHSWRDRRVLARTRDDDLFWNRPRISLVGRDQIVVACDRLHRNGPHADVLLWWSTDGGQRWQGPRETGVTAATPSRVLERQDGSLIMAANRRTSSGNAGALQLFTSRDRGASWRAHGETLEVSGPRELCPVATEHHVVLLVASAADPTPPLVRCVSDSRGWQGPFETLLPSVRQPSGTIVGGHLYVAYRFHPGGRHPGAGANIFVAWEPLESLGEPRPADQQIYLRAIRHDDRPNPPMGACGLAALNDQELVLVGETRRGSGRRCIFVDRVPTDVFPAAAALPPS